MNNIIDSFYQGSCYNAYKLFGSFIETNNNIKGVRFTLYAPNAKSVQVVGNFNNWDGYNHYMNKIDNNIFNIFIEGLDEYELYKYKIETYDNTHILKSDPYAKYSEVKPATASIVYNLDNYKFSDDNWMNNRTKNYDKPLNIYELYAGGFMKHPDGNNYTYYELANKLIPYIKDNGYTHIELLPLNEHPFDGSWGYQATGFISATSRYGTPNDLRHFINMMHNANIGVIFDIVLVHFVKDAHGLGMFDGKPVYEYDNENGLSQWDSYNFNLCKEEIRSFLISASNYWCEYFHVDGLRIDAVSNIIYWDGNSSRGTNIEALNFIKRHNYTISNNYPNVMLIAEDSSSYPNITKPTFDHGLGFDYKWDLGYMNDTLKYYATDFYDRKNRHHQLTFSMHYFYSERFILPFSHDEVVHSKKTIIDKMFGDYNQKFSGCRNLYAYMYAHPGKKLNFMGNELATFREFDENKELDWFILEYDLHNKFLRYIHDLNHIYLNHKALYANDYNNNEFRWLMADNCNDSIYAFERTKDEQTIICIINNVNYLYKDYTINNVTNGIYYELINSDNTIYGGTNIINKNDINVINNTINITIAPLSAIIFLKKIL